LPPRLHYQFVFQQPQFDPPRRAKNRPLHHSPYSVVHSLVFDPQTRRVTGVRVIDAQTKNALEFKARVFFHLRFHARIHAHSAEFRNAGIS